VIFLTAKNDTESILKGFEVGAMDYVTKPFNGMELLARVRTHLALSRARNTLAEMNQVLKKSEEKFRYLANHDNLTQLYNTRYLYAHLPELIESARTEEGVFSLIFFDIDHFKQVVDTYGHLNGSRTIAEVAGTIRRCIQPPAYGVAYAGDEFIVVLPGFSKAAAVEKAEEIRTRMAETTYLESLGHAVRISASFGISTYPEDGEEMRDLLAKADRAMFDIKESGKNAVGF
jgi:diguanylate cyclase (GGDEF)-like protein